MLAKVIFVSIFFVRKRFFFDKKRDFNGENDVKKTVFLCETRLLFFHFFYLEKFILRDEIF